MTRNTCLKIIAAVGVVLAVLLGYCMMNYRSSDHNSSSDHGRHHDDATRNGTNYPAWSSFNDERIGQIVDRTRTWYESRGEHGAYPTGVVLKIKGETPEFSPAGKTSPDQKSFLSYDGLDPCSKTTCGFCKSNTGQLALPNSKLTLVNSRSNNALIVDKNKPTGCWFEMERTDQIQMLQTAQKLVKACAEQGVDVSKVYIEFHCGRSGGQTVGHTHLRLEGFREAEKNWFERIQNGNWAVNC